MNPSQNPAKRQTFLLPKPVGGNAESVNMDAGRIKSSGQSETALGKGHHNPLPITAFRGEAVVAQTLRWVSTASLHASKELLKKKSTPEVQTALVNGRLVIGTNSLDDSYMPDALRKTIANARGLGTFDAPPVAEDAQHWEHDLRATKAQTHRHIQALSDFTDDKHPLFKEMVGQTTQYYDKHISRHKAILEQDPANAHSLKRVETYRDRQSRTVQSLTQVRDALRNDGFIHMAPRLARQPTAPGTPSNALSNTSSLMETVSMK